MPVLDAAGAFVDLRQVGVEVARIALARRYVPLGGRHLAQGLGIVGHVGHHHQDMEVQVEGQIFRRGQGHARQGQALHRRVVGPVDEHHHVAEHPGGGELVLEEAGVGIGDPHGGEHDGEAALFVRQLGLTHDLRRQAVVGQAGGGEDRQFLAPHQGVETVDGGDAGLDELPRDRCGRPG